MKLVSMALGGCMFFSPGGRAQLPPDHTVVSSGLLLGAEPGQRNGTFLVTVPNTAPTVIDGRQFSALAYDPYDGTILLGFYADVRRAVLQGASLVETATLGVLAADRSDAIRFDEDGNLVVLASYWNGVATESRIHRVLRSGGSSLLQILPAFVGALDLDERTGIAYLVSNPGANLYRLDPPYASPPALVNALTASAYGIGFLPLGNAGQLLVPTSLRRFLLFDLASSTLTTLTSNLPFGGAPCCFQYHARTGRTWGLRIVNGPDSIHSCFPGPTSVDALMVTDLGLLGSPMSMTMNGIAPGSLYIAPMNVPATSFLFEAGVWGRPGDLGLLVMTRPFVQVVAVGLCDAAGVLAVKFPVPAGAVQPGSPGQLEFTGATVNLQTLGLTLSAPRPWPRN